ncbi:MAG: T9SS type A sorting domain-containing protein [Chitinophagaceae bacterium]|nr:T9SS type A sorting domain-containing protein [Chitinophagaceae bacterium]
MMKKIYTLLFFAAFSISAINAQTGVAIGSNGGQGSFIIGTNVYGPMTSVSTGASWNRHAYIYPASLLAGIPSGSTIDSLFFFRGTSGATLGGLAGTVSFKIYLKNTATNAFAAGTLWSNEISGADLVYDSDPTAEVGVTTGFKRFDVGAPFVYTGGNLEVLVEYTQSAAATGEVGWIYDNNTTEPAYVTNSVAYISGTTGSPTNTLSTLNLRHPAMLVYYTYLTAVNPGLNFFTDAPGVTCHSTGQTIAMELQNYGTDPIGAGAAAVTLDVTGANIYNATLFNTGVIPAGGTETITFSGVNLGTAGNNDYTAYVNMAGDPVQSNDSLFGGGITASNIAAFPAVEDVETTLPVVSYVATLAGGQAWSLQNFGYINVDLADSLHPYGGENFFLFDSYNSAAGTSTRLFSNCVTLTRSVTPASNSLTFFMSHDSSYVDFPDSLYVSISEDKGATWTRIAGFARYDAAFVFPDWRQETVDLSAFGCKTIQIGFEAIGAFGNVMGLDDITINSTGDLNCAVPVTLVGFTVQKLNKANKLSWKTSQELNTLKFVVEQSRNGREFIELGQVAAAGNSNTERTYTYTHNLPEKGYNYYRIKMVDIDNSAKYSAVRSLQNLGVNEISSYPNPVRSSMQVSINAEKTDIANVLITDLSGKTIYSKVYNVTEGDNNFTINTAGFTAGNYILKVQLSGEVVVKKFSKL